MPACECVLNELFKKLGGGGTIYSRLSSPLFSICFVFLFGGDVKVPKSKVAKIIDY